jgi:hypothetical protein
MSKLKRNGQNARERRASPRVPAKEVIPQGTARLATGQEVELVNINLNGALLIRSIVALTPGSIVQMKLDLPGSSTYFGGRIRRCRITNIKQTRIQYEAAVIPDDNLPLPLFAKVRKFLANNPSFASLSLQEIDSEIEAIPQAAS